MRSRLAWLPLSLAAAVAFAQTPAGEPIVINSAAVPLDPRDPSVTRVGKLEYRGGLHLTSDDKRFGGLSALSVSGDGAHLTAVSDEGGWLTAGIVYDGQGRLKEVTDA